MILSFCQLKRLRVRNLGVTIKPFKTRSLIWKVFNESHYKTFCCCRKAKENEKKTSGVQFQGNFKIELIYNLIGAPCTKDHNFPSYEI